MLRTMLLHSRAAFCVWVMNIPDQFKIKAKNFQSKISCDTYLSFFKIFHEVKDEYMKEGEKILQ